MSAKPPPLIATLTVNPALDIAAEADAVRPGHKIRTSDERYDPGGGGLNVAKVLHRLGASTVAVLASGGVTGRYVEDLLTGEGVPWRAVAVCAPTRVSYTVRERASGQEYRFVPRGAGLEPAELAALLQAVERLAADWLVVSGSLPPGVPDDFYARIVRAAAGRGLRVALDTSGAALAASIGSGIEVLKPSLGEFESLVGPAAREPAARERLARALAASGAARLIALSLGPEGAVLATAQAAVTLPAEPVALQTGVGAGDSFLAGLVLGLAQGRPLERALRLALATAAVAVSHVGTAQVRREEIEARFGESLAP